MAGNFMNKPATAKSVAPKKIGAKKPTLKGLKPKASVKIEPIEEAPTLKEVEEAETTAEPVQEETSEPIVEQTTEEVVEEVQAEPEEEVNHEDDDDKFEDKAIEEITEDANKEEVTEEVKEEKPKAKKRTRKKSTKEDKQETTVAVDSEPLDVEEYKDYMEEVIRPSIQEWEDEKEEVRDKMSTLNLDPNMNPKEIRQLLADLADMHKTMQDRLEDAEINYDNTNKLIESIEIKASVGANSDERKLKALLARENYVKEGETKSVNLTVFRQLLKERVVFYKAQVSTLEYNKYLVMTFQKVCSTETKGF